MKPTQKRDKQVPKIIRRITLNEIKKYSIEQYLERIKTRNPPEDGS